MNAPARLALALALLGALPAAGAGAPGLPAPVDAGRLYQEGNRAAKRQQWSLALSRWAAAEGIDARWQYAYNQATVLRFLGRLDEAWAACERARDYGVPIPRQAEVDAELRRIETALLRDHALLRLSVEPPDAEVLLDGQPFSPPRRAAVTRAESRLVVRREGFLAVDEAWSHPVGAAATRTVRLASAPVAPPVTAPPAAAPVTAPPAPPPPPVASSPPSAPSTPTTLAAAGTPPASGPGPVWKWVAFGLAAGAGTAGGLVLNDADDLRTPSVFRSTAGDAQSSFESRRDLGFGLVGAAGVALVTGVVLWALEPAEAPSP
jgi:hypothetical protein